MGLATWLKSFSFCHSFILQIFVEITLHKVTFENDATNATSLPSRNLQLFREDNKMTEYIGLARKFISFRKMAPVVLRCF